METTNVLGYVDLSYFLGSKNVVLGSLNAFLKKR